MTTGQILVTVIGLLLSAAVLSALLRAQRPELAMGLGLVAGVLVVGVLLGQVSSLVGVLRRMLALGGLSDGYLSVVLRAAGVCLLTQLTADTCRDAGETALAGKAELTGRVLMLLLAVPLFQQVLTLILGIMDGRVVTG